MGPFIFALRFGVLVSMLPLHGATITDARYSRQQAGLSDDEATGYFTASVQREALTVRPGSSEAQSPVQANVSLTRAISLLDRSTSTEARSESDAASDIVLGLTIMAVTIILVAVVCLYVDRDDDLSASKRNARRAFRGSAVRSGGERPVPHRPVPTSYPSRMSGAPAGGYSAHVGSPGMAPGTGPTQPLREGSDHSTRHMHSPAQASVQPPSPPQVKSPLETQLQPQAPRNPMQAAPTARNWDRPSMERASIGSSFGGSVTRSMSGLLGTTALSGAKRPPALCAALVLPHCEAWFAVSWDKIVPAGPSLEFYGLSGKALLRATVTTGANGTRKIGISMTPVRSPTLGSCSGGNGSPIQVHGAADKPYGELRQRQAAGQFTLVHHSNGEEVVALSFGPGPSNHLILTAVDGSPLAAASRCIESDFFSGIEHLEVRVHPGVDAVLMLCCVLGSIILEGGDMPTGLALGNASPQV